MNLEPTVPLWTMKKYTGFLQLALSWTKAVLESLGVFLSQNPWSFYFYGTKLGSHNQLHKPVVQVLLFSLIHSKQHKHTKGELNIN